MSVTSAGGARSGTVEFIGWAAPQESSEIVPPQGPIFDADTLARTAQVHEDAGFDRVLIGYFTNAPDGFLVGAHVAHSTERLGLLLAHRPGFVAPTLAARKLATLDQLSTGRAAVHIISGGSDEDQARDGDFTDHGGRYRRSAEYVRVLRRTWAERRPFDHHGEFYRVEGQVADITPWNGDVDPGVRRRRLRRGDRGAGARRSTRSCSGASRSPTRSSSATASARSPPTPATTSASACRRGRSSGAPRARRGTAPTATWRRSSPGPSRPVLTGGDQRRLAAPARRRRPLGGLRPLPLHAARRGDRRARQLDGPRRHARDGGRGARRLRRRRRRRPAHPRLRAARATPSSTAEELIPRTRALVAERRRPPR